MSQKRLTDAQVFSLLEGQYPGLFHRVKDLKVGEHIEIDGFTISSELGGVTKIVRPEWVNKLETPTVN